MKEPVRTSKKVRWLQDLLRDGPVSARTINRRAREQGWTRRSMEEAKAQSGATYDYADGTWSLQQ